MAFRRHSTRMTLPSTAPVTWDSTWCHTAEVNHQQFYRVLPTKITCATHRRFTHTHLHPFVIIVYYCGNLSLLQHDLWHPHCRKRQKQNLSTVDFAFLWHHINIKTKATAKLVYSPAYVLMSGSETVAAYRRAQGASQQSFCIFPWGVKGCHHHEVLHVIK